MSHTDICGEDTLVDIYTASHGYDTEAVIRWCYKCGAIVVDIDFDGRTQPGAIMSMRFPQNRCQTSARS